MFRYVAVVWNSASETQNAEIDQINHRMRACSTAWQIVFNVPGLRVYCIGIRPNSSASHLLSDNSGVVLGTVFRRIDDDGNVPSKAQFGPIETRRILETDGRELVDQYWGRYIGFIVNRSRRSIFILRSPTGEIDCLNASIRGIKLYFSGVEDCPLLNPRDLSINWNYVAADISTLLPETRETGLTEVERILHGECVVEHSDGIERRTYWHPFNFVNDPIENTEQAAEVLRNATRACVHAWASCYEGILGMLSGGLDSSVVVSLLRDAPTHPRIACLNYRNPYDSITDERRFARLVAAHVGCPLTEHLQNAQFTIESLLKLTRRASPFFSIYEIEHAKIERELARAHGAGAYFLGMGGDQLFFQNGADYICADFIHDHGLQPRMFPIALDAARMEGGSIWSTLRRGLRDGLRRNPIDPVIANYWFTPLLRPEVTDSVRKRKLFIPAWFNDMETVPPGKCWQIMGLSLHDDLHSPCASESDPEYVLPLLSQPLQELCLRIPSYVLTFGARDRGLARFAFRDEVPLEILKRRDKGFVGDYNKAIFTSNFEFVRDLLLDSILVKERIIDKQKLEQTLSMNFTKGAGNAVVLLQCAATEAWLRGWTALPARIAA